MPQPKDNEVLVRVHATTVTAGDWRMRKPDPFLVRLMNGFFRPRKNILGTEFSGTVEAVGKDVKLFSIGDQVFGGTGLNLGANAEFVCIAEDAAIARKPSNITFEEAAAIPFGGTASLGYLRDKGMIERGQKVLINGASGALGTYAVQLARYYGAEVTGVCSTRNLQLVKSLGAHHVVDYTQEDFTQQGKTYDVIFDTVGKTSFAKCKDVLNPNGLFLAASGGLTEFAQMFSTSMFGDKKVKVGLIVEKQADLEFLKERIEAGDIRPVIDRKYTFEEMAEAHRYVEKGHKAGNVVVTVG
jgi:NADPH2:quinone reductase